MSAAEPEETDDGPIVCSWCGAVDGEPCAPDCDEAEVDPERLDDLTLQDRFFADLDDEDSWDEPTPRPEQEPGGQSHSVPPDMHEDDIPW